MPVPIIAWQNLLPHSCPIWIQNSPPLPYPLLLKNSAIAERNALRNPIAVSEWMVGPSLGLQEGLSAFAYELGLLVVSGGNMMQA